MRIPLYRLSIMLLQGMKPRMGTLSWKVKAMALFKGGQSESVQPQIMQASPAHRRQREEQGLMKWVLGCGNNVGRIGFLVQSRCVVFLIHHLFLLLLPNSSWGRGSHSTPLSPGQPTCPISPATVRARDRSRAKELSLRSDVCGSWKASLFTCEIMRWKAVWLGITSGHPIDLIIAKLFLWQGN